MSAVLPQSKHIVVMVDHGASVTDTQLQIARDSALVILNAADEHDKVSKGIGPRHFYNDEFINPSLEAIK